MEKEMVIEATGSGERLDVLLASVSELTRSRIAGLIREGRCQVQGQTVQKPGQVIPEGVAVRLTVPPPKPITPQAQDLPLNILFEDDVMAVVDKPCGMVVHPAAGNEDGTLVNALLFHLNNLSSIGGSIRPGIVHRLDKETSGVLLIAKNDQAQLSLSEQLQNRTMEKHYLALVEGVVKDETGYIEAAIARSHSDYKKMAIDPQGRYAATEWRVLARGRQCSLLDVHILTGRTHQIRVHMRSIGHPVCGDPLYGSGKGVRVPRMMLHAFRIAFDHPVTGVRMQIEAPLPENFMTGLQRNGINWTQE